VLTLSTALIHQKRDGGGGSNIRTLLKMAAQVGPRGTAPNPAYFALPTPTVRLQAWAMSAISNIANHTSRAAEGLNQHNSGIAPRPQGIPGAVYWARLPAICSLRMPARALGVKKHVQMAE
jgi:hypothetical protein